MSDRVERKTALLIGIDKYDSDWILDLKGCIEDIRLAEAYIKELVGIPESEIVKLLSPSIANLQDPSTESLPTRDNVVSAFQKLASNAQQNDIIYIHYSGHGTRLPTYFPNLKPNNQDESIVLVCHKDPKRRVDYLRDVEIASLLKEITDKGALVTIVLDCCCSGGATRAAVRVRGVDNVPFEAFVERGPIHPLSILEKSWTRKTTGLLRGASVMDHWMTSVKGIEFLAACQAHQNAQEIMTRDGIMRGLLTGCLNDVLNEKKLHLGQLSCDMVYNLVSRRVTEHKTRQYPQDVVFGGQRSRLFFGVDSVSQEIVTIITGVNPLGSGQVKEVSLNVGKAHGVVEGDSFAVYPADKAFANITDYNSSLAIATVRDVDDFVSVGTLDGCAKSVQRGCKAMKLRDILKLHVLSPRRAGVFADHPEVSEQKVREVKDKIKADGKLIELTESDSPFFEIRVKSSGDFQVSFTHKVQTAMVTVQSTDILLSYLTHLAIYYNLFNLGSSGYTSGISVKIIGTLPKDIKAPAPRKFGSASCPPQVSSLRELASGDFPDILHGESIGIQVRNTTFKSMYLEILDLEPSWQVSRIYPWKENAPVMLESGESVNFFITMSMPADVTGSVQPETFDAFIILATTTNQCNFPEKVLPVLDKTLSKTPLPLRESENGRGGTGVYLENWFAQRLDVRVVK